MDNNGPTHGQSHLLDSPDYWIDEAEQLIDSLRLEIQILKQENQKLKSQRDSFHSVIIGLGLEIEKLSEEYITVSTNKDEPTEE